VAAGGGFIGTAPVETRSRLSANINRAKARASHLGPRVPGPRGESSGAIRPAPGMARLGVNPWRSSLARQTTRLGGMPKIGRGAYGGWRC
jgi:hypothetical protein